MKLRVAITVIAIVLSCLLITKLYPSEWNISANADIDLPFIQQSGTSQPAQPADVPATEATTEKEAEKQGETKKGEKKNSDKKSKSDIPQTKQEIIQKYTDVMNKMKTSGVGYQKKEYQALPEEYRNFSSAVNVILKFAEGYMTTEDNPNSLLSRDKGMTEELRNEITICGIDKGCALLEYDPSLACVKSASCEDLGDGTYKLSFMLNDEINPEPTPADTGIPVSAHGAVFAPASRKDIMVEVEKVEKLAHATCNNFELKYTECYVECIYEPETDRIVDLYQRLNVDITADITLIFNIAGSARLTNDNHVYDIVW